jgi:hypothetical protein
MNRRVAARLRRVFLGDGKKAVVMLTFDVAGRQLTEITCFAEKAAYNLT